MQSSDRWFLNKSSKIIPLILFLFIIYNTEFCTASDDHNYTLAEISSYNFTEGFYNVVKYAEDINSDFEILHETEIPILNLSYTAPSDGYLSITIIPVNGPVPYIILEDVWETNGYSYMINILSNQTVYFVISPPLSFSDTNTSQVVGGAITIWEMYVWPELAGYLHYSFIPSDDIIFDIIWYPTNPRQEEKISLFTNSNAALMNITWIVSGNDINWVNQSEILELKSFDSGDYIVRVTGLDEFNQTHIAQEVLQIKPPIVDLEYFNVKLFSISHPESVLLGESIKISAIIDYNIPNDTEIKCSLTNPVTTEKFTEDIYVLDGNGSTNFNYEFVSYETGTFDFILQLLRKVDEDWIEIEGSKIFSINVAEPQENNEFPVFPLMALFTIIIIRLLVYATKKQNIE
jgi:hypothetical protein